MQPFGIYRPKYLHIAQIFPALWLKVEKLQQHVAPGVDMIILHWRITRNILQSESALWFELLSDQFLKKNSDQKCNSECLAANQNYAKTNIIIFVPSIHKTVTLNARASALVLPGIGPRLYGLQGVWR